MADEEAGKTDEIKGAREVESGALAGRVAAGERGVPEEEVAPCHHHAPSSRARPSLLERAV